MTNDLKRSVRFPGLDARYVGILVGALLVAGCEVMPPESVNPSKESTSPELLAKKSFTKPESLMNPRDFSFGYYLNGWRSSALDGHQDILCYETGYYGFQVDAVDLTKARFGRLEDVTHYEAALDARTTRMENLSAADLDISVTVDGKKYRAVSCRAGESKADNRMQDVRLWESGRIAQNFELYDITFKNDAGVQLPCLASLHLAGWPESLALTAEVTPSLIYRDGPVQGVEGAGWCVIDQHFDLPASSAQDAPVFTLEAWVNMPENIADERRAGWLICKGNNEWEDGNIGFMFDRFKASAIMNIGGGATNVFTIPQKAGHLPHDSWHHLALTYDGKNMKFYFDGVLQGREFIDRTRAPLPVALRLANRGDGAMKPVRGLYDEVRVWNRPLSEIEIAHHAQHPTQNSSPGGMIYRGGFSEYDNQYTPPPVWNNAIIQLGLKSETDHWLEQQTIEGEWTSGDTRTVSLVCDVARDQKVMTNTAVMVSTPDGQVFPVMFDARFNGLVAPVAQLKRSFKTGYEPIGDYDEFFIDLVSNGGEKQQIPFMLYMIGTANSTGMSPILCDEEGVPTGIPVQLSKNWHYVKIGDYLRASMLLPAKPGATRYRLRIPYGFYGTLPSASHAQLSLMGWGSNGRWDQLAIGCWGETICFDMDMSPTPQVITDVRALMVRHGVDGKKWEWTDAGWGGDWFNVSPANEKKLAFTRMKTAYLAHGPCLTDVRYRGFYGSQQEVDVRADVQTLRTDDFMRTMQRIRYVFKRAVSAEEAYLFRMDGQNAIIPNVAYGNRDGLIEERDTPEDSTPDFIVRKEFAGEGPWWVAFPGSMPTTHERDWGTASRGLVIRSFRASFDGVMVDRPTITVPGDLKRHNQLTYDMMLTPPAGVSEFKPGDWVEMDVEWITVPRVADDYYGPNETFRSHLAEHPASWRTVHREAVGNDLDVTVSGGKAALRYPIIIETASDTVTVNIKGGVGFVPIRFDGLVSAEGYALYEVVDGIETKLDQSVHGNDFWQTDFDAGNNTYRMSFNLPLDNKSTSTWILKRHLTPDI
jgi:Concanavalin A-like lectin/glucanases superfamily